MWPDRVSNPGPLTYESGALPTALRGPAFIRFIPERKYQRHVHVFVAFTEPPNVTGKEKNNGPTGTRTRVSCLSC